MGDTPVDAKVFNDSRYEDAKVYEDAHEYHDAHIYNDAPAPRSCTTKDITLMYGTAPDAARTITGETLEFNLNCGGYGTPTPPCSVILWDDIDMVTHDAVAESWTVTCNNQFQTFQTTSSRYVHKISCSDFDVVCDPPTP
ncbi:MAG: hypothetical protein QM831_04810 [Kofleriaceae bacterium]